MSATWTIPRAIRRGPTDVLKLLSKTVRKDVGLQAPYTYVDDPLLLPQTSAERRSYALSRTFGEHAADYAINKFPYAFHMHKAWPEIPSYDPALPEPTEGQLTDPDPETLLELISHGKLDAAMTVYQNMDSVDDDIRCILLECLCAYAGDKPSSIGSDKFQVEEVRPAEAWYISPEIRRMTWMKGGWADSVLADLEKSGALVVGSGTRYRALCAMINGQVIFGDLKEAWSIFAKMLEENILPCAETLPNAIRSLSTLSNDAVLEQITEVLKLIASENVKPSDRIFCALFDVLASLTGRKSPQFRNDVFHFARELLAEVYALNMNPSLGLLNDLLVMFERNGSNEQYLDEVIDMAEELPEFKVTELKDCYFFPTAMKLAHSSRDYINGRRISNLLSKASSQIPLLPTNRHMTRYHENLLSLTVAYCPDVDEVQETWTDLVPNVFTPSPSLASEFMDFLVASSDEMLSEWARRLFQSLNRCRLFQKDPSLLSKLLYLLSHQADAAIGASVAIAALRAYPIDEMDGQEEDGRRHNHRHVNKLQWDDGMLSDALLLLCRNDQLNDALQLSVFKDNRRMIDESALQAALDCVCRSEVDDWKVLDAVMTAYAQHEDPTMFREAIDRLKQAIPFTNNKLQQLLALRPNESD